MKIMKIMKGAQDFAVAGEVLEVKKVAPCGCCGRVVLRDEMYAMNTLIAEPVTNKKRRFKARVCADCIREQIGDLLEMEWDNASMREVPA